MKETQRHRDAYKFWLARDDRNLRAVAREFSVSEQSVHNWKNAFNWFERAAIADAEIARRTTKQAIDDIVAMKAEQLRAVLERINDSQVRRTATVALLNTAIPMLRNGEIEVTNLAEIEQVFRMMLSNDKGLNENIKMAQLLLGEEAGGSEINVTIELPGGIELDDI